MELYFAGDSSGFPDITPKKLIWGYNVLLSYTHPSGKKSIDDIINTKKGLQEMDLYLAGNTKGIITKENFDYLNPDILIEFFNVLLSYAYADSCEISIDNIGQIKKGKNIMELYLVGPEKQNIMKKVIDEMRSNILFNFVTGKKATDEYSQRIKPKKLFIDSGAFSAWTQGKILNVDEYIDWINDRPDIDLYGQIDVIPGDRIKGYTQEQINEAAKATWENYLYMYPKMKNPNGLLFTFHMGEPYYYLEQALKWKNSCGEPFTYMALGGMVGKSMVLKKAFLSKCFSIIKKINPRVKVHAFGMTSFSLLEQYPIDSADSTSWIMTGANGGIMTDIGTVVVSDKQVCLPEHYSHLPKNLQNKFEETIEHYGFTLEELRHSRDKRIIFNAQYMNKKAAQLKYIPGAKQFALF